MNLRILSFFVLAVLVMSCSDDDNNPDVDNPLLNNSYPQTWRLIRMSTGEQDSVTTGENMEWQETYVLNDDDTFVKTRVTADETLTGSGTYVLILEDTQSGVSLTFEDNDNSIIGTCATDDKEFLRLNTEEGILVSNWQECDGPGLFYEISSE
ncbi:hypothetical protein [Sinomicrobium oceani]|uniref:hypothetical protein n=1 Tax=Sinomicrobium oceani TaxID=1150368 RepID=UPI00227AB185|nr:hypothetical protein [Sinomicrobium oceani]